MVFSSTTSQIILSLAIALYLVVTFADIVTTAVGTIRRKRISRKVSEWINCTGHVSFVRNDSCVYNCQLNAWEYFLVEECADRRRKIFVSRDATYVQALPWEPYENSVDDFYKEG